MCRQPSQLGGQRPIPTSARAPGKGRLGAAEDALFRDLDPMCLEDLAFAAEFYQAANRFSDEELAAQDFTREELWDGLHEVMALYGVHIPGL